ncbi:MAG: glycine dehydrogenase (aminomethyl-transferring), partial [Anaerolineae bacterium]
MPPNDGSSTPALARRSSADDAPFLRRHIGPRDHDIEAMLEYIGYDSLEELVDAAVPDAIRLKRPLRLPEPVGEDEMLAELRGMAGRNRVSRSVRGMGYSDCVTP